MLKIFTLSGYEGVGKSTLINHFQQKHNFNVIPETARLIMPLEKGVLRDSRDDLSYKSFISYLTNIHFMTSNNLSMNVISDRNIIDSLTYLELYSKEQRICIKDVSAFLNRFLEEHNREYLYDEMILISHSKNDDYILNNILSDPERKYGKNIEQYKQDSAQWEDIYKGFAEELASTANLSHKLIVADSYPQNRNIITDIEKTIFQIQ